MCNLASLSLPSFLDFSTDKPTFSFHLLESAVRVVTRNLNKVIDRNKYATEEGRRSNMRHRPLGMGVQGLADVFASMRIPFGGEESRKLNRDIFETLYYSALDESCSLSEEEGPYSSFIGSPASKGILQFDMWGVDPGEERHPWKKLKKRIEDHGLRNSLLVAPMPTASTAQILGNTECFEPITSNTYVRSVLAGEFVVVNKHLVKRLEEEGLWVEKVRQEILSADGSVQDVPSVPQDVKDCFKTVWEMSMRTLIDMAAERAPFVDQSQSLNLFMANPTHPKLSSMHFYSWKKGLKTGMYYLRTRAAAEAVKVTLPVCNRKEEGEACTSCSA